MTKTNDKHLGIPQIAVTIETKRVWHKTLRFNYSCSHTGRSRENGWGQIHPKHQWRHVFYVKPFGVYRSRKRDKRQSLV